MRKLKVIAHFNQVIARGVDLTQEKTIEALETVTVRTALIKPTVVATIRTFAAQEVKITIAADGGIEDVEVQYASF